MIVVLETLSIDKTWDMYCGSLYPLLEYLKWHKMFYVPDKYNHSISNKTDTYPWEGVFLVNACDRLDPIVTNYEQLIGSL